MIRFLASLLLIVSPAPAIADQEAGNVAHVAAGQYGRCYVKAVPEHIYDPDDQRQEGATRVYRVDAGEDELLHEYDWFAQQIFVLCAPYPSVTLVRLGPWHRGHATREDHVAIAFYRDGELIRSYSTLDIAGPADGFATTEPSHKNISASVSHYNIFEEQPHMVRRVSQSGFVFSEDWFVEATTIDGRKLVFDPMTGEIEQ